MPSTPGASRAAVMPMRPARGRRLGGAALPAPGQLRVVLQRDARQAEQPEGAAHAGVHEESAAMYVSASAQRQLRRARAQSRPRLAADWYASLLGFVVWTMALAIWWAVFQAKRVEWGAAGDRLSAYIPRGQL